MVNVDPAEIQKFGELAHKWWDPNAEFKPLHDINPVRIAYIDRACPVDGRRIVDVGCGGGILSEGLAVRGATVTGIDLSDKALTVARLHLLETGASVDYRKVAAEELAAAEPAGFDIVTCMEMIEHVPDPASTVRACMTLAKPGGRVFFSTINRNPKAYLFAVVGAEYLLKLLPRGTHDYARFIKPSELARLARDAGLDVLDVTGMSYNPFTRTYSLGRDTDVNYLMTCAKG